MLLVYKVNPRLVRKQLPPDDDVTRRNLLYRQLFTEFDRIDIERRREMLEGNKHEMRMDRSYLGALSPPLSGSSRSSPPVDVKFKYRHDNRNSVSFAGDKTPTNETNHIDSKILKSKSGNAIDKFLKDVEVHGMKNGVVNGKTHRPSKIPQSKTLHAERSGFGQLLAENCDEISRKSSISDSPENSEQEM